MVLDEGTNNMLTTSEVARMIHIHVNTVRRWSDSGFIKTYRLGSRGDRRFKRGDIARFLVEPMIYNKNKTKV